MQKLYDTMINVILVVNGIYDILCACSIIWLSAFPFFGFLSNIHPTLFSSNRHINHQVIRRFMSYWILTYGIVRTTNGFYPCDILDFLGAMTYFIEAFCFEYELRVGNTMIESKVRFVSVVSIVLAILVLLR